MSFYSEVIRPDPRFDSPARVADLALLEPVTRQAVQAIINDCRALGHEMMVFETFRSHARQQQLFNQGVTHLRAVGVHNFGLACDIVKSVGGEPNWKGDFSFLAAIARNHGLIWGGDWGAPGQHHSFIDLVHVQRCSIARQPSLFSGTWYPDDNYNPYSQT
jgi:hypothetical protein